MCIYHDKECDRAGVVANLANCRDAPFKVDHGETRTAGCNRRTVVDVCTISVAVASAASEKFGLGLQR